jgi:hypothetical protein
MDSHGGDRSEEQQQSMALFDFRRPDVALAASICFVDEVGLYSIGDLINATWIQLTNPEPIPNWLQWYRLIARLCAYARLDAVTDSCLTVVSWPSRAADSSAAGHVFRDETGEVSLDELIRAMAVIQSAQPTLALRFSRAIVHLAELDERRDTLARSLLERAGIVRTSADSRPSRGDRGLLEPDGS